MPFGHRLARAPRRRATTRIATACTGVFAVAETGRMHHRRATTSWFLGPEFLKRYPTVDLDLNTMAWVDGNPPPPGAAFAHIDLGALTVRLISPDLAQHVAKFLIIDERPSAAFVAYEHLRARRTDRRRVRTFRARPTNCSTSPVVARRSAPAGATRTTKPAALNLTCSVSVQRFASNELGTSATTDLTSAEIALRVGYANAETAPPPA